MTISAKQTGTAGQSAARRVTRLIAAKPATDGAGVRMKRLQGVPDLQSFDPFLMLDEFKSDDPNAYIGGFPDHPHRGFETVTYLLAGRMRHSDNHGHSGLLGPGGVQWMTAGRGIVHSEMPEQENGLLWGFQLWLNLPAKEKMIEAGYRDISAGEIPSIDLAPGVTGKLIAGHFGAADGPGHAAGTARTAPIYVDLHLAPGAAASLPLPETHAGFVYVYEGEAAIGKAGETEAVGAGRLAALSDGATVAIANQTANETKVLLLAGQRLGEPIVQYGPFVMNSEAEIHAAIDDYRAGRF
ncbi:pirin family protein [Dongia soli]|uniref:Pirin family protein n=1 Tax=Dongia soli TaxID=600628 RepID=A0ABU5E9E8_9PROT|nr:pirin family protein [Dongia soli]MDY0882399.1 pirin family protein [Dongia soli]